MIVQCEACGTKYRLDESLLKPKGTKVRCSRCGFIWTLYPYRRGGLHLSESKEAEKTRWYLWVLVSIGVVVALAFVGWFFPEELLLFVEALKEAVNKIWLGISRLLPQGMPLLRACSFS